jgi:hypothetical protein
MVDLQSGLARSSTVRLAQLSLEDECINLLSTDQISLICSFLSVRGLGCMACAARRFKRVVTLTLIDFPHHVAWTTPECVPAWVEAQIGIHENRQREAARESSRRRQMDEARRSGTAMQIMIAPMNGAHCFTLEVTGTDTIRDVKVQVQEQGGPLHDDQRLILHACASGPYLENHRTLADYGIRDGTEMDLLLGLHGGCCVYCDGLPVPGMLAPFDVSMHDAAHHNRFFCFSGAAMHISANADYAWSAKRQAAALRLGFTEASWPYLSDITAAVPWYELCKAQQDAAILLAHPPANGHNPDGAPLYGQLLASCGIDGAGVHWKPRPPLVGEVAIRQTKVFAGPLCRACRLGGAHHVGVYNRGDIPGRRSLMCNRIF